MSLPISKSQQQVLEAWQSFTANQGRTPSVRELCKTLGRAPSTIHQLLRALQKKGLMQTDGSAHGWKPCEKAPSLSQIRIRGSIAAGAPIEAIEQEESLDDALTAQLSGPDSETAGETYALRVRGDSMIDDHIVDGDVVLVRRVSRVDDGEIAVALLNDGTATLKRVYREPARQRVRLQPANSRLAPIYVDDVVIQGKVVGVMRTFGRG